MIDEDIEAELMKRLETFDLKKALRKLQFADYIQELGKCSEHEARRLVDKTIQDKGYDWLEANFIIFLDKEHGSMEMSNLT